MVPDFHPVGSYYDDHKVPASQPIGNDYDDYMVPASHPIGSYYNSSHDHFLSSNRKIDMQTQSRRHKLKTQKLEGHN